MAFSALAKCLLVLALAQVATAWDWPWNWSTNTKRDAIKALLNDSPTWDPQTQIKADGQDFYNKVTGLMKELYGPDGYGANKFDEKKHHADDKAVFINYAIMQSKFQALRDQLPTIPPKDSSEDPKLTPQQQMKQAIMTQLAAINNLFKNKKIKEDDVKAKRTKVLKDMETYMTKYHKVKFDSKTLEAKESAMSKAYESMEKSYKELSSGGMGWGWWVLIILLVVGIGAGIYCFFAGKSDEDEEMDEL